MTGAPTIARPPTIVDRSVRLANKYKHAVLAASLVGLLAVIGFATATAKLAAAKQVSDAHAEQSLHKEGIAREAIDRLGNQVAQSLSGIPAANAVRHQLLQETLDYYQQFADAPPVNGFTDRRRAEDLAVTFGKMGVLQSELGDYESAVGSLKSSESGFRELAAANAGDPSLRLRWTISQNNLAEGLVKFGDHEAATQCFTDAIAMQRQMHQSGDKAASVELAKTLNNLAGMLAETDHDDAATLAYGQAIKLLDSFEAHSDLRATMQSNLAGVLASREPAAAAELARSSLIRQLGALESNPGNPKLATQVVVTLNTLAKAHSHSANHKAAVQTLRQAADVGRQLHTRWPDQLSYRRDLVVSLNALGMSLSKLGRLEPAGVALKQAAMHGRKLNDVLPESAEVQSMLGGVLNNLGSLQQQLGHPTAARECFHEAFEHQQIAADLAPQESRYRTLLETHQVNLIRLGGDS